MSHDSRAQILGQLQDQFQSPVLSYVTGDRNGLGTQIAADQLLLFPRHLTALDSHEELNLVLYTRGGETTAAWPIMSFLREHCKRLRVLVPFYAHSAGTLLSLGADEIVMTRYATLSPIDPTVANAFNPQDPANPANRLPIAVEDVMAFLQLAKDHSHDPELPEDAFRKLGDSVHPLALGNVQRSINQIRQLARKMLALHPLPGGDGIDNLVNALTTEFYSHQHLVNRREAAEMGLPVVAAAEKLEQLLLDYYEELCADLELRNKWDPAYMLRQAAASAAVGGPSMPAQPTSTPPPGTTLPGHPVPQPPGAAPGTPLAIPVTAERGYVETTETCDAFVIEGVISQFVVQQQQQVVMPGLAAPVGIPQVATKFEVIREEWRRVA